ncbi:hypothetical protein BC828DRAFT_400974 [Blastocladiella britannica]|nr:hypothetical protein BC828DRAFT_400974 [Blastocladiella britannica]
MSCKSNCLVALLALLCLVLALATPAVAQGGGGLPSSTSSSSSTLSSTRPTPSSSSSSSSTPSSSTSASITQSSSSSSASRASPTTATRISGGKDASQTTGSGGTGPTPLPAGVKAVYQKASPGSPQCQLISRQCEQLDCAFRQSSMDCNSGFCKCTDLYMLASSQYLDSLFAPVVSVQRLINLKMSNGTVSQASSDAPASLNRMSAVWITLASVVAAVVLQRV